MATNRSRRLRKKLCVDEFQELGFELNLNYPDDLDDDAVEAFLDQFIDMVADKLCVELKSLKMYMWSYRNEGAFHEKVTNDILSDMVKAINPRYIRITAKWYVRGGIYTNVVAEHRKKGWKPQPRVDLPAHGMATGLPA